MKRRQTEDSKLAPIRSHIIHHRGRVFQGGHAYPLFSFLNGTSNSPNIQHPTNQPPLPIATHSLPSNIGREQEEKSLHLRPVSSFKLQSGPLYCNRFKKPDIKMAVFGLSPQQEIIFSIVSYSLCSGSLVLVNKLTLHYLPFPSLVVTVQLVACIVMIYTANMLGKITVDPIKWECVKPYLLYTVFFSTGVYCNMRSLNISNVETVIVFRALSPALVAFMDALLLGREWPSKRSWVGLLTLVAGAYGYASYDEKFQTQGASAYYWPTLYTVIIALEMVCSSSDDCIIG
jgi:uncharacterized membrane protein